MNNNSTNRPRLGSAILDPLLDNITNNTPNSILSSSWLPSATSSKGEDKFNAYNTLNTGIQGFRHPSGNSRPLSPLTTKILSLIQQKPWQSWDTYKINNGTSSPRYPSPKEMMENSGYTPLPEETEFPFTAEFSGEGLRSLEGKFNASKQNYKAGFDLKDTHGTKNMGTNFQIPIGHSVIFGLKANSNINNKKNLYGRIGVGFNPFD